MIPDKENITLIDQYVHHLLEGEELIRFEKEMDNNAELKERVVLTQVANKILLKNKLWEMKELTKQRIELGKKEKLLKQMGWMALSALLFLGGIMAYFYVTKEQAPEVVTTSVAIQPVINLKEEEILPIHSIAQEPPITPKIEQKVTKAIQKEPTALQTKEIQKTEVAFNAKAPEKVMEHSPAVAPKVETVEAKKMVDPIKNEPAKTPSDLCSTTKIEASINMDNACANQANGVIMVSNLRGGAKPYQVKILDEHQKERTATHLASGVYSILITDHASCKTLFSNIHIKEETCEKDFEINPSNGDVWEYGLSTISSSLSVYDAGENLYFYKQFNPGEKIHWNGMSSKGDVLPGYFLFVLKYQDGKSRAGSITIQK